MVHAPRRYIRTRCILYTMNLNLANMELGIAARIHHPSEIDSHFPIESFCLRFGHSHPIYAFDATHFAVLASSRQLEGILLHDGLIGLIGEIDGIRLLIELRSAASSLVVHS